MAFWGTGKKLMKRIGEIDIIKVCCQILEGIITIISRPSYETVL